MQILTMLSTLLATAAAIPHKAIINTPSFRDVGVVYTESNYQGLSLFLLENRENASCYPLSLDADGNAKTQAVGSIKVCMKDCICLFSTGAHCGAPSADNFVAVVHGPGDVADVQTPVGHVFKSYACGEAVDGAPRANVTLVTAPHAKG